MCTVPVAVCAGVGVGSPMGGARPVSRERRERRERQIDWERSGEIGEAERKLLPTSAVFIGNYGNNMNIYEYVLLVADCLIHEITTNSNTYIIFCIILIYASSTNTSTATDFRSGYVVVREYTRTHAQGTRTT